MNECKLLRDLQKLDIEIGELTHNLANLPQQKKAEKLKNDLQSLDKLLKKEQDFLVSEQGKQKKAEGKLEPLDLKIKHEDDKLYSGTVANPKELKSIQQEVNLLKVQKDKMETGLLELLDTVDNIGSEIRMLSRKSQDLGKEVEQAEKEYKKAADEIKKKLQDLRAAGDQLRQGISPSMLSLYEKIRKQKKEAVVEIAESICQGCFMELPAQEVDKMLQNDKLWQCPQCRRIIIR